jgi:hypothetical protein
MAKRRPPKDSDPLLDFPITRALRNIADEQFRERISCAAVAERYVSNSFGDAAAATLKSLMPEDRAEVAIEAFRRRNAGSTVAQVTAWLSLTALKRRRALETAAQASYDVINERKRGGLKSAATRRAVWPEWRDYICEIAKVSDPAKAHRGFKNAIIDVIRFRNGANILEPPRHALTPMGLPKIPGHKGKPPSEATIRRRLFNSRKK